MPRAFPSQHGDLEQRKHFAVEQPPKPKASWKSMCPAAAALMPAPAVVAVDRGWKIETRACVGRSVAVMSAMRWVRHAMWPAMAGAGHAVARNAVRRPRHGSARSVSAAVSFRPGSLQKGQRPRTQGGSKFNDFCTLYPRDSLLCNMECAARSRVATLPSDFDLQLPCLLAATKSVGSH